MIEPVIGHINADHRMGRNDPRGLDGDRAYAILAAAGFDFPPILSWFAEILRDWIVAVILALTNAEPADSSSGRILHG